MGMTTTWDSIYIASIPLLVALVSLWQVIVTRNKVKELHIAVNGRLTELLETTRAMAHAEGKSEGLVTGATLVAPLTVPPPAVIGELSVTGDIKVAGSVKQADPPS